MKVLLSIILPLFLTTVLSAAPKNIAIIAGHASHGWNEHEFPTGSEALAHALNESGLELHAMVHLGWPEDESSLAQTDAIVLYCDGIADHVAKGKAHTLRQLYENGANIAVLHFALEPSDQGLADFFTESIGGYFEVDWSVNPVWTLANPILANHEINSGIASFTLNDEWYYHMRFADKAKITPILSAHPPLSTLGTDGPRSGNPAVRQALENQQPQHLAWTKIGPRQQRGFGFTGGHFLHNWNNDTFRTLVLNGIAWTTGFQIPNTGIPSKTTTFLHYPSLSRAIAYNDAQDIELHLARDPQALNRLGKSKLAPLHEAILRKKIEAARLLIEKGADVNLPDRSDNPPLHIAINRKLPEIAQALIDADADLTAKDKNGWTALHLAAAKDTIDIAKLIIDAGADIHIISTAGGTPLHEAAASGSSEMVQLLLNAGVDPSIVSSHEKTALDIAREFENEAAIKLLSNPNLSRRNGLKNRIQAISSNTEPSPGLQAEWLQEHRGRFDSIPRRELPGRI